MEKCRDLPSGEDPDADCGSSLPARWLCPNCSRRFSVLTRTLLSSSKLSPELWLQAVAIVCSAPGGASARDLEIRLRISYATARFLLHRIRAARSEKPLSSAWKRATAKHWRLRKQIPWTEVSALEEIRRIQRDAAGALDTPAKRRRPLTLWPLTATQAFAALLQTSRSIVLSAG